MTSILSLSPLSLADLPEPFRSKVRALLKPHHPFFSFALGLQEGDLVFSISVRNLLCQDAWIRKQFPTAGITGIFPLESFADPAVGYARFEAFVFRSLMQLMHQLLGDGPSTEYLRLVPAGHVNWSTVALWVQQLFYPLRFWFDYEVLSSADGRFRFAVGQPVVELHDKTAPGWLIEDIGQQIRPWHGVESKYLISLDQAVIEAEAFAIAVEQGEDQAEALLRKLLMEQIANGLYNLRLAL